MEINLKILKVFVNFIFSDMKDINFKYYSKLLLGLLKRSNLHENTNVIILY